MYFSILSSTRQLRPNTPTSLEFAKKARDKNATVLRWNGCWVVIELAQEMEKCSDSPQITRSLVVSDCGNTRPFQRNGEVNEATRTWWLDRLGDGMEGEGSMILGEFEFRFSCYLSCYRRGESFEITTRHSWRFKFTRIYLGTFLWGLSECLKSRTGTWDETEKTCVIWIN